MTNSQQQILQYCAKNVAFDGWCAKLLENASLDAGLDRNYWRVLFPNGVLDAADAYVEQANERMAEGLDLSGLRVPQKVAALIKNRLTLFEGEKPAIRATIALYMLHPFRGTQASYRTVDAIWRLAGDTATDWNFYSKRALLAGVYASTLNFWLEDKSENHAETWEYLNARLGDVAKFGKFKSSLPEFVKQIIG